MDIRLRKLYVGIGSIGMQLSVPCHPFHRPHHPLSSPINVISDLALLHAALFRLSCFVMGRYDCCCTSFARNVTA